MLQTIALPISLGLSRREVAETLHLSEFTVSTRYDAIRQRLWELSQEQ